MRVCAWALFAVAAAGFTLSLLGHAATYSAHLLALAFRVVPDELVLFFPFGIFALYPPLILLTNALLRRRDEPDGLNGAFRRSPGWFRGACAAVALYTVVNFLLMLSVLGEGRSPGGGEGGPAPRGHGAAVRPLSEEEGPRRGRYILRTISGHVMAFYFFAAAFSYLCVRLCDTPRGAPGGRDPLNGGVRE